MTKSLWIVESEPISEAQNNGVNSEKRSELKIR